MQESTLHTSPYKHIYMTNHTKYYNIIHILNIQHNLYIYIYIYISINKNANLVKDQPSVALSTSMNYKIDEEIFNQTINQLITNKTVVRLTFHNTNINHQHTYTISQMLMKIIQLKY